MLKRFTVLFAIVGLGALFVAPAIAHAAFGIEKWESLTCSENVNTPANPNGTPEPNGPQPNQCTGATSSKLFTQAGGHPPFGITDFTLNTFPNSTGVGGFPEGFVKKIVVDTPEGLSVNPEATPQCTLAQLQSPSHCPQNTIVGVNYLTINAGEPDFSTNPPTCKFETNPVPICPQARAAVPVWNMVSFDGVPSMVAFLTKTGATFIEGSLSPVDQHVTFTIKEVHLPNKAEEAPPVVGSRLVFFGGKSPLQEAFNPALNGTYLTMPSNCAGPQVSKLTVTSWEGATAEQSYSTPTGATGCENVPFNPEITVSADGTAKAIDSPEAMTVDVGIPFDANAPIANSYLKTATVTLPEGVGINPSAGNGLQACTAEQFGYHKATPVSCPEASKIGTVEIQTPSLPVDSIQGNVYVGEPLKNGPGASASGEQFRIFIYGFSTRYGVNVRLIGSVTPNPVTGQLTAVVRENPQATFRNFRLHFTGGNKGVLSSPPTCGTNTTTTEFEPWSGNPGNNKPTSNTEMKTDPAGGACPTTLAARKFAPGFTTASTTTTAAQYSPYKIHIGRGDGQQEIKAVNITLPKGLVGRLAGIPYCGEAELAAAAASSGRAQLAKPSCPGESAVGQVTTSAGTGGAPLSLPGTAYLAGPYKGAPLSLAIVTPAVAGPYDLGTVVVRTALKVDPFTAQINAVSDPIPNVFGGVKLDVRSIDIDMNRFKFMLNPTNCAAAATAGTLNGGGANPALATAWSSAAVSAPFQATACNKLGFKPSVHARIKGGTTRAKNPQLRVVVQARSGDANIARTSLNLPHALFLDQSHIKTICTRVQLAEDKCPSASVYGHAEASSPLLKKKLTGPVYLVSSKNKLPDLLADLKGQINIQLDGVIDQKHGGLRTVFSGTPDVPLKTFVLNMQGGKKSLLQNSTNICKNRPKAILNVKGQNGKVVKTNQLAINVASCGGKKK
jgi:hypothetical protein